MRNLRMGAGAVVLSVIGLFTGLALAFGLFAPAEWKTPGTAQGAPVTQIEFAAESRGPSSAPPG